MVKQSGTASTQDLQVVCICTLPELDPSRAILVQTKGSYGQHELWNTGFLIRGLVFRSWEVLHAKWDCLREGSIQLPFIADLNLAWAT